MANEQNNLAYLASPYSHSRPDVMQYRLEIVNRVAFEFHRQGKFVYSPLTHNIPLAQSCDQVASWDMWSSFDVFMLNRCDEFIVLTLDGWQTSNGVAAEMEVANELNIPIHKFHPQLEIIEEIQAHYNDVNLLAVS